MTRALNLREHIICAALNGLLADPEYQGHERKEGETCQQAVARLAIEHSDAVLDRLMKEKRK